MGTPLPKFMGKLYAKGTAAAMPYLAATDKLYAKGAAAATPYLTATDKLYARGAATATLYLTAMDKLCAKGAEMVTLYLTATDRPYAKGAEMVTPYLTATERYTGQVVEWVELFTCQKNEAKLNQDDRCDRRDSALRRRTVLQWCGPEEHLMAELRECGYGNPGLNAGR